MKIELNIKVVSNLSIYKLSPTIFKTTRSQDSYIEGLDCTLNIYNFRFPFEIYVNCVGVALIFAAN